MELIDLRTECRRLMSDDVAPYDVSDKDLNLRINEAQKEACVRSKLLINSTKPKFCKINIVAGTNNYRLNPLVIDVLSGDLPSAKEPLVKLGYKALYEDDRQWQTRIGTPDGYALDVETNRLYLSHVPTVDEILTLTVSRLPSEDMETDSDEPEINSKYHYDLIYWALHLCYSTQDIEIYDPNAAARYEAKFIEKFCIRPTAKELEHQIRKYRRRSKAHFV